MDNRVEWHLRFISFLKIFFDSFQPWSRLGYFLFTFLIIPCWGNYYQIRLSDNTIVKGFITRYENGCYYIKENTHNPSKEIKIELQKIREIQWMMNVPEMSSSWSLPEESPNLIQLALTMLREGQKQEPIPLQDHQIVKKMGLSDWVKDLAAISQQELLELVAQDQQLQDLLLDESLQQAIEKMDIATLMNHPKILVFMRDPEKVKKILDLVKGKDKKK